MKIEIVEFYALKKKNNTYRGTLHVYLPEKSIDLRGIDVFQKKQYIHLQLPFKLGVDKETKKECKYPVVAFVDVDTKDFMSQLREVAIPYLNEALKNWQPVLAAKPANKKREGGRNNRSEGDKPQKQGDQFKNRHFVNPPPSKFGYRSPSANRFPDRKSI